MSGGGPDVERVFCEREGVAIVTGMSVKRTPGPGPSNGLLSPLSTVEEMMVMYENINSTRSRQGTVESQSRDKWYTICEIGM